MVPIARQSGAVARARPRASPERPEKHSLRSPRRQFSISMVVYGRMVNEPRTRGLRFNPAATILTQFPDMRARMRAKRAERGMNGESASEIAALGRDQAIDVARLAKGIKRRWRWVAPAGARGNAHLLGLRPRGDAALHRGRQGVAGGSRKRRHASGQDVRVRSRGAGGGEGERGAGRRRGAVAKDRGIAARGRRRRRQGRGPSGAIGVAGRRQRPDRAGSAALRSQRSSSPTTPRRRTRASSPPPGRLGRRRFPRPGRPSCWRRWRPWRFPAASPRRRRCSRTKPTRARRPRVRRSIRRRPRPSLAPAGGAPEIGRRQSR